jgi:N-acetylneuraminate synthase/N,N'-diacetyllegionaminate synthase
MIDAARETGADGVKFQAYKAEMEKIGVAPFAEYQKASGFSQSIDMSRHYELSMEQMLELKAYAEKRGMPFVVSISGEPTLVEARVLDLPFIKIPSAEVNNLPFLAHLAAEGKPMVLATGMSYMAEVDAAIQAIEGAGNRDLILLHCVTSYPTIAEDVNLRAMQTLKAAYGYPVGFSDHTQGPQISVAAVAMGACFIEKHFTLDKDLPGPDHAASSTPDEFALMIAQIRDIEKALGDGRKEPRPVETEMRRVSRKGLVTTADIAAGELLTLANIDIKKPYDGIGPEHYDLVLGRPARVAIAKDSVLNWEHLMAGKVK